MLRGAQKNIRFLYTQRISSWQFATPAGIDKWKNYIQASQKLVSASWWDEQKMHQRACGIASNYIDFVIMESEFLISSFSRQGFPDNYTPLIKMRTLI